MMHRVLVMFFLLLSLNASATHYRAGELTFRQLGYLSYEVTVTTYTTALANLEPPDTDTLPVDWGDGTITMAGRVNANFPNSDYKINVYKTTHTYAGPLPYYLISMADPNRIGGIENMNNSIGTLFYIEDTLRIYNPSFIGGNSSPILLTPPIDYANLNDTFFHNPGAFDPDGDSLTFELVVPLQGTATPVSLYRLPDLINPGIDNNFTLDNATGEITWAVPKKAGIYNIAILVREYREGTLLGTVLRDMQIIVRDYINDPPVFAEIRDTCIIAGTLLNFQVSATDPNVQTVNIAAYGGPLNLATTNNPADFVSNTGNPAFGTFQWQSICNHIRRDPYQVVFRAVDNYVAPGGQSVPLTDVETMLIRIVGPPPQNVVAIPNVSNDNIDVSWQDPYACGLQETDRFLGFTVWRRIGSNPFPIDTCTVGLAGRGYTQISDMQMSFTFSDSTATIGQTYCYRILAHFGDRTSFGIVYNQVESLPSEEACTQLARKLPIITNVDVNSTDAAAGQMFVRWVNPIASLQDLDTILYPGPYEYRLIRGEGLDGAANRVQVVNYTSNTFTGLDDTTYTDNGLNTSGIPYAYEVEFYTQGGILLGASERASSIFLNTIGNDRRVDMTFEYQVPWINARFEINRKIGGVFTPIDTVDVPEYVDRNLVNGDEYCYMVRGFGVYTIPSLPDTLFNKSQESCAVPQDSVAPCVPVLTVANNCGSIEKGENCDAEANSLNNNLSWNNVNISCDEKDALKYRIYYAVPGTSEFNLIDSVASASDTTFSHRPIESTLAGCYAVTAIDTVGNESAFSNIMCVDNCPCYILPNVFTPNNDGDNDLYTPRKPYLFVYQVDMKIYNRWGYLVFETTDPNINWDGNDSNGKPLGEDVYYYVCRVLELRDAGVVENPEILNGYIHLIRGNGGNN